ERACNSGAKVIYLRCSDIEKSWSDFSSQFHLIRAAGGVVLNDRNEVLFIYRLDKWDLPKGKVEKNEELDLAALREVEEECSIGNLIIERHLATTYHTYALKGEQVLKSTDWFIMKHAGNESPQPQTIEGITDARWIAPSDWSMVESNTFPSVLDVLRAFEGSK
ncbi:MAG: NUDIX hydrolase, partial [Flavobacteriales bacterium]